MHLFHHGRRDAEHPFAVLFRGQIDKWTIGSLLALEFFVQDGQGFDRKSGADLARENKVVALVIADQDSAEILARALRRRESADDKLLFVDAFEFYPCTTSSARFVKGVAQFANNSFETAALHFLQELIGVATDGARVTNRVACV